VGSAGPVLPAPSAARGARAREARRWAGLCPGSDSRGALEQGGRSWSCLGRAPVWLGSENNFPVAETDVVPLSLPLRYSSLSAQLGYQLPEALHLPPPLSVGSFMFLTLTIGTSCEKPDSSQEQPLKPHPLLPV